MAPAPTIFAAPTLDEGAPAYELTCDDAAALLDFCEYIRLREFNCDCPPRGGVRRCLMSAGLASHTYEDLARELRRVSDAAWVNLEIAPVAGAAKVA